MSSAVEPASYAKVKAQESLSRSRFPASLTQWANFGSQSSRCKRVFRAYLFERSRISALSELILHRRAGKSAEKSISGFSDSVGELRLAELSL
ncbi:hypothetical protein GC102_11535 [Paenibacillus sp. LMG 31460]|uniref:Uncharacterized protein n=1 Tax=Paenibacillus germinis TaxID=2654979 RepID=A0ABX1YZM1_9BACL|nr:hypothetical protein [Paenibacillus germinis]NOU86397.1 hypothetical protein [Paenibacillus germinis]